MMLVCWFNHTESIESSKSNPALPLLTFQTAMIAITAVDSDRWNELIVSTGINISEIYVLKLENFEEKNDGDASLALRRLRKWSGNAGNAGMIHLRCFILSFNSGENERKWKKMKENEFEKRTPVGAAGQLVALVVHVT